MPPKKTTSRKKRGKKKSEKEVLNKWVQDSDKINGKSFAKHLPTLAAELRDGTTDKAALAQRLTVESFSGDNASRSELVNMMAQIAVPDSCQDLRERFRQTAHARYEWLRPGASDEDVINAVYRAFSSTCESYKTEIVARCFGGNEEAFLENCKGYKTSPQQLVLELKKLADASPSDSGYHRFRNFKSQMDVAVNQVERGVEKTKRKCWECDKEIPAKDVKTCSRCHGARYCGRDCQTKAWKEGHRNSCRYIEFICSNLEANLEIVDKAHADPQAHEEKYGFKPSVVNDYMIVGGYPFRLVLRPIFGLEFPNMTAFYKNLMLVSSGRLWVDPSLVDGRPVVPDDQISFRRTAELMDDFSDIAAALALDFSSYKNPVQALHELWLSGKVDPTASLSQLRSRAGMTPREFITIYFNSTRVLKAEPNPRSVKLEAINVAYTNMRSRMHKLPNLSPEQKSQFGSYTGC